MKSASVAQLLDDLVVILIELLAMAFLKPSLALAASRAV
jgi:hypothetical protein